MLARTIKDWLLGSTLALGVLSGGTALAVAEGEAMPGISVPRLKGVSGAGAQLTNESLPGKVTVINFWATWCAACKVELIEMEDQFRPYLAEKDFQVAFVSLDKEPAKAVEWFQGNLKDPEQLLNHLYLDGDFTNADKLQVDSFPMTIVIGRDGKIAHVQRGYKEGDDSTKRIVAAADKLLKAH
jgi:thiol-disulfide isomerase/thioredoxin